MVSNTLPRIIGRICLDKVNPPRKLRKDEIYVHCSEGGGGRIFRSLDKALEYTCRVPNTYVQTI